MRKSIFELENRLDINVEYKRLLDEFHSKHYCKGGVLTFIQFVDSEIFKNWKYRDTFLYVEDYLMFLGLRNQKSFYENIKPEIFLRYIEFILNMLNLIILKEETKKLGEKLIPAFENMHIILEKMNYCRQEVGDKIIICKRSADVDSVLPLIEEKLIDPILRYNDFQIESNLEEKRKILKDIDLKYIEKNKKAIKEYAEGLYKMIGLIVNEMGVNHNIGNKDIGFEMNEKDLLVWYDRCFLLMLQAIRTCEIVVIKNELSKLKKEDK